jgi:predicted AlkP superfamily pyrophosphatase or phosphodiesterase
MQRSDPQRTETNLPLHSLVTTEPQYGPMSHASFTAMALLDSYVKRIVDTLQEEVLMHRATVIVVSDHGFRKIKHKLHPNVLLREGGLITGDLKHTLGDACVASTGGTAMVYVSDRPERKSGPEAQDDIRQPRGHSQFTGQTRS